MPCVAPDVLEGFVAGSLDEPGFESVEAHVDECSACRAALGELASRRPQTAPTVEVSIASSPTAVDSARDAPMPVKAVNSAARPGNRIDRYVVLRVIGEGGMGVVTLARDPELRRKVVIKLVRPEMVALGDSTGIRSRLMLEAQAMARVSHENVVPIYDVGTLRDQVFIAMEYIEGWNLAQWLAETPRRPSEILAVFRAAGRGLAAAHAAKLIHRDFKPHNVLIGRHGSVVKVTDFGLARALEAAPQPTASAKMLAATDVVLEKLDLTRTGMLLGTPAYMSPEQILATTVDHRSDQFSFCIALYQALYGIRPFAGTTMETLYEAISQGKLETSNVRVDKRVRAALVRGLSAAPEDRFPSMTELLAALSPPSRVVPIALAAGAIVAIGAGVFAATRPSDEPAVAPVASGPCDGIAFGEVWNATRRSSIPHAPKLADALDQYTTKWTTMRRENCEASRVAKTQPELMMVRREGCLDRARRSVGRAADALAVAGDSAHVESARIAIRNLPDLTNCTAEGVENGYMLPHDLELAQQVVELTGDLGYATINTSKGRFDDAEKSGQEVLEAARKLQYPVLEAEALIMLGRVEMARGKWDAAAKTMTEVVQVADLGQHDRVKGEAQLALAEVYRRLGRDSDAERYRRYAQASLHEAGSLAKAEHSLAKSLAKSYERSALAKEALAQHEIVIRSATAVFGEQSRELAEAFDQKARLLARIQRHADAIPLYKRSQALYESQPDEMARMGALIPRLGLLETYSYAGRHDEAIAVGEKLLADGITVAQVRVHLAMIYADRGDGELALRTIDPDTEFGLKSSDARGLALKAFIYDKLGRYHEAEAYMRRSLALSESSMPPDTLITYKNGLGSILVRSGRYADGIELLAKNLAYLDAHADPDKVDLRTTLSRLASAYVKAGKLAKAIEVSERGLAMASDFTSRTETATFEFALARGRYATDREGALKLANQARANYASANDKKMLAEVDAWLAAPK